MFTLYVSRLCINLEVNVMMEIKKENLIRTAENARLYLTDEEVEQYTKQVNHMISYVKKIQEINTDDVEPTTHGNSEKDVLRNDSPVQWKEQDQAFDNA